MADEKSIVIKGTVDMRTEEAEKKKKELEKPIKTKVEIDTSKLESSLIAIEKSLKRVITGNEQYGYKIKIDTSSLNKAQEDIGKLWKYFNSTLKKNKSDDGKVFYKIQVEGIDKIQEGFQQLTTIVNQFKDQMNSINGRSVREIETDIARVNSAQAAMKKLVAAPVDTLYENLKGGSAAQKSINLFLKNVDDYVAAGGKLQGLKTKTGEYNISSILGELNNQGLISDDRLNNYLQAGTLQADNFKITLQGLNSELEKAKAHEDKDFNVGFKQEDIDRLTEAFAQLDGKSIGLSEDQVNNITNSFTQLQTVLENIRDLLSSFDIPRLESPKTIKIFDGVKEQIFDVEKNADALKKKLQEVANSMSLPQFNKGVVNSGDDLQNIIKHNKPGTLGTGLYTQSNYVDIVDWGRKGLRAIDFGQYSSNLLHFADDDELDSFMNDFSNKLNQYVLKMSKFSDIVNPQTIKSVNDISDIDALYDSVKSWCDKLNVDLETLKSFITEEINYVNSFLDIPDMRQHGQKTPISNFLKNVLGKNGVDVTRTAESDNTTVGSMIIDLNKTRPLSIDFGENYDIGQLFYSMVLEKIAKQKATIPDFNIDDFIRDWIPEDLKKIPEFMERLKSEFAKGQELAQQVSFEELNPNLGKVTQTINDAMKATIAPKDPGQYIGFSEDDIQRITQAFNELKTILENIHTILSSGESKQQIGFNEEEEEIEQIVTALQGFQDVLSQIHEKIPETLNFGDNLDSFNELTESITLIKSAFQELFPQSTETDGQTSFKGLVDTLNQIKEVIPTISQQLPEISEQLKSFGGDVTIKDIDIEQIGRQLQSVQKATDNFNTASAEKLTDFFVSIDMSSESINHVLELAVAIETLGTAVQELYKMEGFQETLAPINDLLKNADQLKNLASILSASTGKIKEVGKATQAETQKTYSAKDYISDIKNYYKYAAKKDTDSQFLAQQYLERTQAYTDQINEKRQKGIALTKDELQAYQALDSAQKKYAEGLQKEQQLQEKQKTDAINSFLKESGTDKVMKSAENLIKINVDAEDSVIKNKVEEIRGLLGSLNGEITNIDSSFDSVDGIPDPVRTKIENIRKQLRKATEELKKMNVAENATEKGMQLADPDTISRITKNFESWIGRNPKAQKTYSTEIEGIRDMLSKENINVDGAKEAQTQINELITKANQAKNVGKTFADTLRGSFGNLTRYLMTFASFYRIIDIFKRAINVVKELDSALTEMRKVSDESVSSLKNYQLKTFDMADKVGTTAVQIQNSTADWLRLGKSFEDAQNLATQSTVLLNVSEFKDIQSATEQLVSATQAYDELDATAITDKLNIIGNNFAVGTSDLAQGLQNAAAVLKTQGNDIDEALALLTAGNLIGQDISKQSAGVRTISLRIAGTKEAKQEIQDMGEDVDDFVVRTTSNTDKIIRDYTAVQSNAYKGISVLDENGNLRSTYDILLDISKVYREIQEEDKKFGTNRAQALVEELQGKNRSNIASSILLNSDILEQVKQMSENDYMGSQAEENAKYLDSIDGKMNQLKNRLQELVAVTIDSEWLKDLINLGTKAITTVTKFGKTFGVLRTAIAGISAILLQKSGLSMFLNKNQNGQWEFGNFGKGFVGAIKNAFKTTSWTGVYKDIFGGQDLSMNLAGFMELKGIKPEEISSNFQEWYLGIDETTRGTLTLNDAMRKFGESTVTASSIFARFKSIGINALSTLGTMLITMAASWAINKAFSQIEYAVHKKQHTLEEGQEAQERIDKSKDDFNVKEKYINDNTERFAKLRQGVSETGKNISLSNEEYAEYLDINQKLAEYLPTLVSGFDAQGNALLRLSGNAEQTTESIKNLLEQERQIQAADILKDLPTSMDQAYITMRDAHDAVDTQKSAYQAYSEINDWFQDKNVGDALQNFDFENGRIEFKWDENNATQDEVQSRIQSAVQKVQLDYTDGILDTSESNVFDGKYVANWKADPAKAKQMQAAFKEYLSDDIQYIETQMASQNQDVLSNKAILDSTWQQQAQNILSGLQLYGDYNSLNNTELGSKIQDIIQSQVSNFDIFSLSDEQLKVFDNNEIGYIYNNIVDPLIDAFNNPDKQITLDSLIDFDANKMTNEEQRNTIDQLTKDLFDGDKEKAYELQVAIGFMYKDEDGHYREFQTDRRNSVYEQLGGIVEMDENGDWIRSKSTNQSLDIAKSRVKNLADSYHKAISEGNQSVAQMLKKQLDQATSVQLSYYNESISWDDITKLTQSQQDAILQARGEGALPTFNTFEGLITWLDKYMAKKAEVKQSGTLADIFAMEDFDVSPFEDKLSAINTALSSLRENGELTADEQLTLQKQIPDLTDFSLEQISDKGISVLDDYIDKMREYAETADLGEEGTKQFEKYISNLTAQQARFTPSMDVALNAMKDSVVTATGMDASSLGERSKQVQQYNEYVNALQSEYGDELDMNVIAYMTMEDMFSGSAEEVLAKYEDAKVYVDLELGENNLDKALREQLSGRNNALLSLEESKRQNKTANGQLLMPEDYDRTIVLQSGAVEEAQQAYNQAASEADELWAKYKNTDSTLARQKFYTDWLAAQADAISKEQDLNQKQADLANTRKEQAESEMNPVADSLSKVTEKYNSLNEAMQQIENAHGIIPQEMSDQAEYTQKKIAELNTELGDFYATQYKETGNVEDFTKSNDYYAQANTATQTAVTDKARTFESTMMQYSDQLTDLQDSASAIQEDITLREGRGLIPTLNQYSKLLHNGEQQLQNLKDQNYELRQQQYEVSDNQEKYREIGDQIRANESAIASMKSNMLGWSDAMRAYAETVGSNLASAIQSAISESMSETGITSATMKQLQAQFEGLEGFDFSDIFYNTANGVKLDMSNAKNFVDAQYRTVSGNLTSALSRQRSELSSLQTQYNSTTSAAEKLKLATQIDATKSGIDNLYNQLSQYQAQIAATQKQFTQFAEFQRAQETANAGDTYKTIQGYMETQQKAYDLGEVGTDEFKAFTAMGDEWGRVTVEAYEANQAKLKRYLTEDAVGIKNFYDDLVKAGFGTYDDENGYRLDISDYSEAAHALGIGEELMKYTMQRSEDFGFYNDYVENTIDGELKLQETEHDLADAIERKYDLMQKGAPKDVIDEANAEIERLDERTVNLNDKLQDVVADASTITSTQIQSAVDVLGEYKKRLDSAKTDSEKYAWQKEMTQFAEQHHIPLTFDYDVDTAKLDEMFAGWSERGHNLRLGIDSSSLTSAGYDSGKLAYTYSANGQSIVMTPVLPDGSVMNVNTFSKYMSDVAMGVRQNTEGLAMRVFDGENAQQEAQTYANVLNTVNAKMQENEGFAESLTSQLGQFTYEELSSIDYADGKLAEGHEQAEQAVDSVMRSLGLSSEQAQQFIQLLSDMGVVQSDVAGREYNISLGVETGQLEGFLSGTRYEGITSFDAMSMSADQLQQKLNELSSKQFVAHVKAEGGEEAYAQLEEIIKATEKQYNLKVGVEAMDELGMDPETFLGLNKEDQIKYMVQFGVDSTNFDAFVQLMQQKRIQLKVDTYVSKKGISEIKDLLENDPDSLKKELEVEFDGNTEQAEQAFEELKAKVEGEEASMKVALDDKQFETLLSTISASQNQTPINITINTVQALQSIAVISAAITALRVVAFLPINIKVNTETAVANANALRDAINEIPKNTPVKVNARVYGTNDVYAVRNQINSVDSTSVKVTVSIGSSLYNIRSVANELNSLHDRVITVTTIKTTVNAASGSTGAAGTSNNIRKNTWTRETSATGTLYGVAHASGTAYNTINTKSISAYAGGKRNVALPKDEDALVNELNPESIIRDGKWFVITGGPHVEHLKKGDIILNSWQTADLLTRGKTSGRGKLIGVRTLASGTLSQNDYRAFASGSAFSGMSAHAAGVSGGKFKGGAVTVTGSNNTVYAGNNYYGQGNDGGDDDGGGNDNNFSYEVFDYVELRLKYFADQTKKIADKITDYVSWATKKNKLHEETMALQKEIQANSRAATTYMTKANQIMHDYVYTDEDGKMSSVDLTKVFNPHELLAGQYRLEDYETTTAEQKAYIEAARAYIDYYDKATDATNAVTDLTNTMRELYDSIIMIPSEKLDDTMEKLENVLDTFNSGMDAIASGASGVNSLKNVLAPFTDLFSKKSSQGTEISTLGKVMDASTSNPAWYTQNALVLQALKKQKEEVNASQTALREQVAVTEEFTGALSNDAKNLEDQANKLSKNDALNAEQKKAIENKWMIDPINFSNGATVTDELAEAVARYNRIVKAWQSHSNAVNQAQQQEVEMREQLMQKAAEYAQAEQEYIKTALENLDNYYQNIINFNKALSDSNAKQRELMQTIGRNAGSGDRYDLVGDNRASFEEQLERLYRVRQALTEDAEKQQAFLDRKLETGELIEGSEEWKEYTTQINELKNEAIETQIEIEKLWDEMIQDVYFKPIEEAIDKIKTLRDNVQALQGLISDDMKFTDQGDYTEWGIAHLTADTNTLNSARDEIARSIQLLKQVDEAYNSGAMTSEEYLNKTAEINKLTQDAVKNADSARRSIIKTIEDRYQTEITYINKLIEARKKEIQKAKERFQYDKSLKKSTKEIQLIQQQIRALETLILYWRFYINCGESPITPIRYNVIGNDKRECGMCLKHQKP